MQLPRMWPHLGHFSGFSTLRIHSCPHFSHFAVLTCMIFHNQHYCRKCYMLSNTNDMLTGEHMTSEHISEIETEGDLRESKPEDFNLSVILSFSFSVATSWND